MSLTDALLLFFFYVRVVNILLYGTERLLIFLGGMNMDYYERLHRERKIAEVKALFANGLSCAEIAELVDMPESQVRSIVN